MKIDQFAENYCWTFQSFLKRNVHASWSRLWVALRELGWQRFNLDTITVVWYDANCFNEHDVRLFVLQHPDLTHGVRNDPLRTTRP